MVCVMAILRRQWVDHERLPFPMAQVPLHPLGFAVAPGWTMGVLWSSICLAWLIKRAVLRFGGGTYERTKPFFAGPDPGPAGDRRPLADLGRLAHPGGHVIPVLY